jgi:hypothetical protein
MRETFAAHQASVDGPFDGDANLTLYETAAGGLAMLALCPKSHIPNYS